MAVTASGCRPGESTAHILAAAGITKSLMEAKAQALIDFVTGPVTDIAKRTMDYTGSGETLTRRYRPRKVNRELRKSRLAATEARSVLNHFDCAVRQAELGKDPAPELEKVRQKVTKSSTDLPQAPTNTLLVNTEAEDPHADAWQQWKGDLLKHHRASKQQSRCMFKADINEKVRKQREWFIKTYATGRKVATKIINQTIDVNEVNCLYDKHGKLVVGAPQLLARIFEYEQELATPRTPKTGVFKGIPDHVLPWAKPNLDGFTLETKARQAATGRPDENYGEINILDLLKNPDILISRARCLGNGKAPGPDTVPNELIKNAPDDLLKCFHHLYTLMFMSATTPAHFKSSNSILLYKKGDPRKIENYRPICLSNTLAKLWTALLAECGSAFAEHFDMLSTSQEGFRPHHNTIRQLQLTHNMLVDAKMYSQDIYALYVDLTSAFNSIDHDKMLIIMHKMGFPDAWIDVIADLYDGATTKFLAAGGETDIIHIMRGTLQGDSLSPFLFIMCMEPLIRWCQSGGRGYRFACTGREEPQLTIGSNAYADDLYVPANGHVDLARQASKVDMFCEWGGLDVNISKCAVTGLLYGSAAQNGGDSATSKKNIAMVKKRLSMVKIKGEQLPFLHPDSETYRYLGVETTMTMNWKQQKECVMQKVRDRGQKILQSLCSPKQKVQYIQTNIRQYMTYCFPLALFTLQEMEQLDKLLIRLIKSAWGLPMSTPSQVVLEKLSKCGMGVQSLMVDYVQLVCSYLTRALNDPGPLGMTTRALLREQYKRLGGLSTVKLDTSREKLQKAAGHMHLMRQISLMDEAGLKMGGSNPGLQIELDLCRNKMIDTISDSKYDPLGLGRHLEVPPQVYFDLLELGMQKLQHFTKKEGSQYVIIPASALQTQLDLMQIKQRVNKQHKRSLNKLTLIINSTENECALDPAKYTKVADLPRRDRLITRADMLRLLEASEPQDRSGLNPDQRRTIMDHINAGPTCEHIQEAKEGRFVLELHKGNMRRMSSLKRDFETRDDLPKFGELLQALATRDIRRALSASFARWKHAVAGRCRTRTRAAKRKTEAAARNLKLNTLQTLLTKIPTCKGEAEYTKMLTEDCNIPEVIAMIYEKHYKLEEVLLERYVRGDKQYNVKWESHEVKNTHIKILTSPPMSYTSKEILPLSGDREGFSHVIWENSWENAEAVEEWCADELRDSEGSNDLMGAFQLSRERATSWQRKDTNLTNEERQGNWIPLAKKHTSPLTMEPDLQKFIHIDPFRSINPDKDIHATGNFEIAVSLSCDTIADVYQPNGEHVGSLTCQRAGILKQAYDQGMRDTCVDGQNDGFAHHIARLLTRYQDGYKTQGQRTMLKNHWATPDAYITALQEGLSVDTERFASPLNFTPTMRSYFSMYEADGTFGANHNAYSCLWTGASQCNPEYEAADMDKSVRWALASAKHSEDPCVVAFILPCWEDTAYVKWLPDPSIHIMARVPKSQFKFKKPDHWKQNTTYAGNTKWDVLFFVVANEAGIQKYVRPELLKQRFAEASKEVGGVAIDVRVPQLSTLTEESSACKAVYAPKALSKILTQEQKYEAKHWCGADDRYRADADEFQCQASLPLAWDAGDMWYTDGSVRESDSSHTIGAGVYCKDKEIEARVHCGGIGPTRTINRAEMCGINYCLNLAGSLQDDIIASDSQVSMCWLNRALRAPADLAMNPHGTCSVLFFQGTPNDDLRSIEILENAARSFM